MKLPNQNASELLGKNKQKSINAAKEIINKPDIEAWKCILENSDYIFSFIVEKAGNTLVNEINKENKDNVFELMKLHEGCWDEFLALGLAKVADQELNSKMMEILENGTLEEKIYATRYFCVVKDENASKQLFENTKEYSQKLKSNAAEALGVINDQESYGYYLQKLDSEDEWERIDAAQFLANYGNTEATVKILEAMSNSGMAELIAGEIATLTDLYCLFDENDEKTRLLALEAMDNILSGIPEVWPLGVVLDFKIYECIEKLIQLAKENSRSSLLSKYAQILLKTRQKVTLFLNNDQYTFDEEKDILTELDEIYHLMMYEDENFWQNQEKMLYKELESPDKKRKLSAISVITEMEDESSVPYLIKMALKQDEDETVICESITALARLGHADEIDKDLLLSRITNPNLLAVVQNALIKEPSI